jgi:hypothetical protein
MNRSPSELPLPSLATPALVPALPEAEVVELALLLPRWQMDALEDAARRGGVTVGQLIRRGLGELLRSLAEPRPPAIQSGN